MFFGKKKTHLGLSGGLSPVLRSGEDLFCCLWQSIQKFVFVPLVVVSALLIIILFYGQSWIYFLLNVGYVYVGKSLYKVNFFFN